MWSLPNQSIRTIFQLSSQSLINLKYSLNLDILASAQYDDSVEINAIYFGFENDGMFFSHPTLNYSALTAFKTADNTSCKTNAIDKAIDVRCLDWYYQTKLASQDALDRNYYDDLGVYEKRLNTFTTIYWNHNINILVLSLCTSLLDQNNEFIGVLCIEIQTIRKLYLIICKFKIDIY